MSSRLELSKPAGYEIADLRIRLLGPLDVQWTSQPLPIPRRQVRALLSYLAVHLNPVPREQLCFLFWPDTPESAARRKLSRLLTHLRLALPDPDVVLTSGDQVALDHRRTWSDTAAFEHFQHDVPTTRRNIEGLQQAVDLYRGSFLAGFSLPDNPEFEVWVTQERHAWERRYLEALVTLIEDRRAQGAYSDAIAFAQRYLATDPVAEEIHRHLIELYAAAGNRNAALRQFESCVEILERELGVDPLPETRAAYQAILQGQPLLLPRPALDPAWRDAPTFDTPLVGREDTVRWLEQAWDRARSQHGGVILISGEPGIGKTRLMEHFADYSQNQARVLQGSAYPGTRTVPYYPITQALRSTLEDPHQPTWSVEPVWLAEVARLLPELRARYPDLPSPKPLEPDEARVRLFEALCRLILALASGPRSLVLCLDDLHWADDTTLDWLVYLGPHLAHNRFLILGSYRAAASEALAGLRRSLNRLHVLSELPLIGLDAPGIQQLLHHLGGSVAGDGQLAARLHQVTGGNPFFLIEILRTLLEAGQLTSDLSDLQDLPLPDSIREAVRERAHRLSPVARQTLEAGAVLGPSFDFKLVHLTAGRGEIETMSALDELVARQLLIERDTGYQFAHELTRRAVEVTLNPARRQLLHRRAGRALEQIAPEEVAALALHFDIGGEAQKALQYYAEAVQRAEELFAWREAEELQGRMLALLDRLDPNRADPEALARRGQLLINRAELRFLQGRLVERDADLAALADLAEASGNGHLRLQAISQRARYLNADGRYDEAIAVAEAGLPLAERLSATSSVVPTGARARLLAHIGFAHYFRGEYQAALEPLQAALALEPSDLAARGEVLSVLAYTCYLVADYAGSLAYRQQALDTRSESGRLARVAEDLTDMGILCTRLNRLREAQRYLDEALTLSRKIGSQVAESYALNQLGTLHYVQGDYPAALQSHTDSLELQRATGSRRGEASALNNLGIVYMALGDYAAARTYLRECLAIYRDIGYTRGVVKGLVHLARALAGLGQLADGLAKTQRALTTAEGIGDRYGQVTALNVLAWLYLASGEPAALELAGQAVALAQEIEVVHARVLGLTTLGLGHLARGDLDQARRHTAQAVELLQLYGCIEGPEEVVYLAHSRVLLALGWRTEAVEILCQARAEVWAKAHHIPDREQRRQYLRSWRGAVW